MDVEKGYTPRLLRTNPLENKDEFDEVKYFLGCCHIMYLVAAMIVCPCLPQRSTEAAVYLSQWRGIQTLDMCDTRLQHAVMNKI